MIFRVHDSLLESLISGPTANEFFFVFTLFILRSNCFSCGSRTSNFGPISELSIHVLWLFYAKLRHPELPNLAFLPNFGTWICQIWQLIFFTVHIRLKLLNQIFGIQRVFKSTSRNSCLQRMNLYFKSV